jgi:hypothetical protein
MLRSKGIMSAIDDWLGVQPYLKSANGDPEAARTLFQAEHPGERALSAGYIASLKGRFEPMAEPDLESLYERSQRSFAAGTPEEWYRRLAGETEARAVEARASLTAARRSAVFPLHHYDVPPQALIFDPPRTGIVVGR